MNKKEFLEQKIKQILAEQHRRQQYDKFHNFFFQDHKIDDNGQDVSRKHYKKHLEFFAAGAKYNFRCFLAANRTGKTTGEAYEIVAHCTGDYPEWWEGRKFDKPVRVCVSGQTAESVREVLQYELLGSPGDYGSGMIPKESISKLTSKPGTPNAIKDVFIRHKSGGTSSITFKSFDQGLQAFMGAWYDIVWMDEECLDPMIYSELCIRLMTRKGMMVNTFTPLYGLSQIVLKYMPNGKMPKNGVVCDEDDNPTNRYIVNCDWNDAPHLTEDMKEQQLAECSPHEREARSRGLPALGAGAVYPFFQEDYVVEPFQIPIWYEKAYGLDVGHNVTAAVFIARDPDTGIYYVYSEHYLKRETPRTHADAIQQRGTWLRGAADPAAGGMRDFEGLTLLQQYKIFGLDLFVGNKLFKLNAVEPGIAKVYNLFESGQLKIFKSCPNLIEELNLYRRVENKRTGELEIHKQNDHAADALRYGLFGWDYIKGTYTENEITLDAKQPEIRSRITGY